MRACVRARFYLCCCAPGKEEGKEKKTTLMNFKVRRTNNRRGIKFTATFLSPSVRKRVWQATLKLEFCNRPSWCEVGFKSRPSGVKSRRCCCNKSDYRLVERRRPASQHSYHFILYNPLNKFYLLRENFLPPLLPKKSHVRDIVCSLFDSHGCFENWRSSNIWEW